MTPPKGKSGSAHSRFTWRVRLIAGCLFLVALISVARLYYVQILQGAAYAQKADREFLAPQNPLFDRGTIYFTTKDGAHIAAATDESGVSLAIEPPKIADPNAIFQALSSFVPLSQSSFMAQYQKSGAQYAVVADHLSTTTGTAVDAKNLPGVVVAQDVWRYYPGNSLAAQTIGFVGYSGDTLEGEYGLEKEYETTLERQGSNLYTNFFVQLFDGITQTLGSGQEGDVITTIEPSVQGELERELVNYMQEWHPQFAGGIIMDPETGAIYAMAQNPTFDLNIYSQVTSPSVYTNIMADNAYEMGSIIKPLTMAAGIDAGAIEPTSTYNDTGCITVNTATVCNYDLKARGVIPMQQILSQSLNVGASYIATQLGPDRMRDYFLNHYDFGQETGVDLPNEAAGLVSNLKSPRQLEYDEASFGQGIAMTPLQTIRALASIANGGRLVTPHLGSAIVDQVGISHPIDWPVGPQILQASTTAVVDQMLTTVVDTALARGTIRLPHYSVSAKTGTAQIAAPGGGGYVPDVYLHSYFGYFPSFNARFIIFLFAFEPQGAPYASETWTTVFHDLTLFLINYYNIPPDR